MAVLSYQQTRVALLGLGFGVLTTAAAVSAAYFAGLAAAATRDAVRAADDAVKATRDIGQKQVRALLGI